MQGSTLHAFYISIKKMLYLLNRLFFELSLTEVGSNVFYPPLDRILDAAVYIPAPELNLYAAVFVELSLSVKLNSRGNSNREVLPYYRNCVLYIFGLFSGYIPRQHKARKTSIYLL